MVLAHDRRRAEILASVCGSPQRPTLPGVKVLPSLTFAPPALGLRHTEEMKMWTLLDLLKLADTGCKGTKAKPTAECLLSDEELDHVAGTGGKAGASTNPIED